jgi:hypothetical protein
MNDTGYQFITIFESGYPCRKQLINRGELLAISARLFTWLHYRVAQAQGEPMRITHGELFDIVVDMRRSCETFG